MANVSDLPETLTTEWVVNEYALNGNDNIMTQPTTRGAKEKMLELMRSLNMKITGLNNGSRWERLVRHCVDSEKQLAQPAHYKSFFYTSTFAAFWYDRRFWLYFNVAFLKHDLFLYFLTFTLMYYAHQYSYELYVFKSDGIAACYKYPLQFHCELLRLFQRYTFSGIEDVSKIVSALVLKGVLSRALQFMNSM